MLIVGICVSVSSPSVYLVRVCHLEYYQQHWHFWGPLYLTLPALSLPLFATHLLALACVKCDYECSVLLLS